MTAPARFGLVMLLSAMAAATPAAEEPTDATARQLLEAHNKEREAEKLPPLTLDPRLTEAARLHAEDMAARGEMTHEGADDSMPADRVKRAGYHFIKTGENVARGQLAIAQVMEGWMDSEGHRANILGDYTQMGAAKAQGEDGETYWCVDFGKPRIRLDPDAAAKEAADGIAAARKEAGKSPMEVDEKLAKAARAIAEHMAEAAAKPEDERKPPDVAAALKDAGAAYRGVAVLVISGSPSAEEFVGSLLDDDERKETLMGDHDAVGIGYAVDAEDAPFWCVVLVER